MQLTNEGFVKDNPEELMNRVTEAVKDEIPSFTNLPSELGTNLIQEAAVLELQIQDMISNMMNGVGIGYSNDLMFLQFGEAFGLPRNNKTNSTVNIKFKGKAGVIIPEKTQVSNADGSMIFETIEQDIITEDGNVTILCQSLDDLTDIIEANTINVLITSIIGLESCNNEQQGTNGIPIEEMSAYRERLQNRFRANRTGTLSFVLDQLLQIPEVDKRLCAFKNTDAGLECIVGGGDDYKIALILFNSFLYPNTFISNPSKDETDRTVNKTIEFQGASFNVKYTRPKVILLNFTISITVDYGSLSIPSEALRLLIKPYFSDYIDNENVGVSLSIYTFDRLLFECLAVNGIKENIINGIRYEIKSGANFDEGEIIEPNKNNRIETAFDIAYKLNEFEVQVMYGDNI